MKKVFMLFVIVTVFIFTGMARADVVVYEFDGTGESDEVSFKYTNPLGFISGFTSVNAVDLDSCTPVTGYGGCIRVNFSPKDAYHPEQVIMVFGTGGDPSSEVSVYFYFPEGALAAEGTYYTPTYELYMTGILTVSKAAATPEPATLLLLGLGLMGVLGIRRKMQK